MMREPLKIGIIGTDTSHAVAFTRIINDRNNPHYIEGGKVVVAYPGGSSDFPLSASRVEGYMNELETLYGVERVKTPEEVADRCDAIMLLSSDGRVHLEQLKLVAPYRKPVFIDKPLALSTCEALNLFELANDWDLPVMSCSSLRFSEAVSQELAKSDPSGIQSAEAYGPLNIEPTQSYYYWYGIHTVELLYSVMGPGCSRVRVSTERNGDLLIGLWEDGRIGLARCRRESDKGFGVRIDRAEGISVIDANAGGKPSYANLVQEVLTFFSTGKSPIHWKETVEIISFLEAAERSRTDGGSYQDIFF